MPYYQGWTLIWFLRRKGYLSIVSLIPQHSQTNIGRKKQIKEHSRTSALVLWLYSKHYIENISCIQKLWLRSEWTSRGHLILWVSDLTRRVNLNIYLFRVIPTILSHVLLPFILGIIQLFILPRKCIKLEANQSFHEKLWDMHAKLQCLILCLTVWQQPTWELIHVNVSSLKDSISKHWNSEYLIGYCKMRLSHIRPTFNNHLHRRPLPPKKIWEDRKQLSSWRI